MLLQSFVIFKFSGVLCQTGLFHKMVTLLSFMNKILIIILQHFIKKMLMRGKETRFYFYDFNM